MRVLLFVALFTLYGISGYGLNKLDSNYLTTFGNSEAPVQIIQYFSFNCPHCVELFRNDFPKIRSKHIETGQVCWIFHPTPMDLITVQAMACLERLAEREKRIFIESILGVISSEDEGFSVCYMQKAMELFGKPIPDLQEKEYLSGTKAFTEAFHFLKQEEKIKAVPTISINDVLFATELPTQSFVEKEVEAILAKNNDSKDF